MARTDPTIYMRIPAELKDRLDAAAAEGRRSVTAEVVARLAKSFEPSGDDEAVNALALRLAQTEFDLHAAALEMDSQLIDAYVAAMSALDAVKFNEVLGYECPLEEDDLKEVQRIYDEAKQVINDQSDEDFRNKLKQLEAARDRLIAIRPRPLRELPIQRIDKAKAESGALRVDPGALAHYQIIRRGTDAKVIAPSPPPVEKHAPKPSSNARKRPPK